MFGKIKKCVSFLAGTTSALVAMLGFGGCSESTTAIHKVDVPEECLDKVGLELSTCVEDYIRNGVDANNGSDEPSYAYYGPAPSFDPTLACNDGEGRCSSYQNYYVCENGQWAYAEKCEYGCEDNKNLFTLKKTEKLLCSPHHTTQLQYLPPHSLPVPQGGYNTSYQTLPTENAEGS